MKRQFVTNKNSKLYILSECYPDCMKEIRIALEDAEHKLLLKTKGKLTWKEYLMRG